MSKEAMKLALEALELVTWTNNPPVNAAITALREALAEQPAQPVAYAVYHRMGGSKSLHWPDQHSPDGDASEYQLVPLYTSPPAQRTWASLTDEEIAKLDLSAVTVKDATSDVRAIEVKLKEKNT